MSKKGRTQSAVMGWIDQELASDPSLNRQVEEMLNEMRIEQGLVALRERSGLSQRALAKLIRVEQPRVAKIESGRVKNFEIRTLCRYAAALGARVRVEFVPGRPLRHAAKKK
jgi:predicted XRE-type DNA-binding protein